MTGFGTFSSPAVASDGTVYVGDDLGFFHAITPAGVRKWRASTSGNVIQSSPAIGSDGTIYFRADDGKLYAVSPDIGTIKWTVPLGTSSTATSYSSPSIAPDGTIYAAGAGSKLLAITPAGTVKWTYATDFVFSSPSIAADGTIYLGISTPGNKLVALNPDGTVKWTLAAGDSVSSSPTIGADGTIYFGCVDKKVYAVTPAGVVRWTFTADDAIRNTSPAIASDGSIYIGCDDGKTYALNPDGTLRRVYASANALRASPLIANGRLYFASFDYRLYAVDIGLVSATSAWPMHRQNARRQSRFISVPLAIGVQPKSQTVPDGSTASFSVAAVGTGSLKFQWQRNGTSISGATATSLTLDGATTANAGAYTVVITDSAGSVTSAAATLTVTPVAPAIATQPVAQSLIAGNPATLTVVGNGTAPLTYQWLRNGAPIAGATTSTLTLPATLALDTGSYTVTISNVAGSSTSQAAQLTVVPANFGRLINLSILTSLAADQSFTVGTVVGGTGTSGPKPILVRAMGPTLGSAPFSIPGVVTDPKIDIFTGGNVAVTGNDNWGGGSVLSAASLQVGAFAFSTATSKDAAVVFTADASAPPTSFTAQVSDVTRAGGLVLAEFYDSTPPADFTTKTPHLINMSVLKPIGDNLAAGFVIGGTNSIRVLIRAVGPTLNTLFGVPAVVADPKLILLDPANKTLASNDDWGGTAELTAAFIQVGAFPLAATSKDAAVVITLPPGNYSVQVSPASGATGNALIEVYEVPLP